MARIEIKTGERFEPPARRSDPPRQIHTIEIWLNGRRFSCDAKDHADAIRFAVETAKTLGVGIRSEP